MLKILMPEDKLKPEDEIEYIPKQYYIFRRRVAKNLPCEGYRDYWGEYGCGYWFEGTCEDCVCSGLGWMNPEFSPLKNDKIQFRIDRKWKKKRVKFKRINI